MRELLLSTTMPQHEMRRFLQGADVSISGLAWEEPRHTDVHSLKFTKHSAQNATNLEHSLIGQTLHSS